MNLKRRKKIISLEIENPLDEISFTRETSEIIKTENTNWQYRVFFSIVFLLLGMLFLRMFFLQVLKGNYYTKVANNNRIRKVVIKAPRGIIKDVEGEVLARNIPSFELTFVPAFLPRDNQKLDDILNKIANLTGTSKETLWQTINEQKRTDRRTFQLIEHLDNDLALKLKEQNDILLGIDVSQTAQREYNKGEVFAHVIGYDGKVNKEDLERHPDYLLIDYVGKNGLEETYEKYLHGKHGEHRYEVNAQGKIIQDLGVVAPTPGSELILNIDAKLQEKIYQEAGKMMEENSDATGVVVVAIDPRDGAVRALVSYPSFDNNLFTKGISQNIYQKLLNDSHKPLLNKAISGTYPPGSTFKPLVACAALEEHVVDEHTTVNCQGHINVGQWQFPDWKAHGVTDIRKAIAESCDVYFYAVGGGWQNIKGLGIEQLRRYSKLFGLGDYLGIDLPGEKKGLVPGTTWKFKELGEKWYIGDTYHGSIGQGYLLTTPLQMANVTATIANGGKLYRPRITKEIINPLTKKKTEIKKDVLNEDFISPENIKIVQEGMRQTVTAGSGRALNNLKVSTAGKTGTAQFGNEDKTHSWYVSYGPYENPELAMVVLVEGGGEGHSWAVPLTKEVYKWYFDEERGATTHTADANEEDGNRKDSSN